MLKLVALGIVVGGFMLTGCSPITEPDDGIGLLPVGVEQPQRLVKKSRPTQSDSTHKVAVEFEN